MRVPGARTITPRVGSSAPVTRLNRVVFPVPFRPMMPHFSPDAIVNVTSRRIVLSPNSTATFDSAICVMRRSSLHPRSPLRLGESDGETTGGPCQRDLQQHRVVDELFQPACIAVLRVGIPEFLVSL